MFLSKCMKCSIIGLSFNFNQLFIYICSLLYLNKKVILICVNYVPGIIRNTPLFLSLWKGQKYCWLGHSSYMTIARNYNLCCNVPINPIMPLFVLYLANYHPSYRQSQLSPISTEMKITSADLFLKKRKQKCNFGFSGNLIDQLNKRSFYVTVGHRSKWLFSCLFGHFNLCMVYRYYLLLFINLWWRPVYFLLDSFSRFSLIWDRPLSITDTDMATLHIAHCQLAS